MNVTNTREALPKWFHDQFGGVFNVFHSKRSRKHAPEYRWIASGLEAAAILRLCLPYLTIKRKQALLALEFASTIDPTQRNLPASYQKLREEIHTQMCQLNKRGPK